MYVQRTYFLYHYTHVGEWFCARMIHSNIEVARAWDSAALPLSSFRSFAVIRCLRRANSFERNLADTTSNFFRFLFPRRAVGLGRWRGARNLMNSRYNESNSLSSLRPAQRALHVRSPHFLLSVAEDSEMNARYDTCRLISRILRTRSYVHREQNARGDSVLLL